MLNDISQASSVHALPLTHRGCIAAGQALERAGTPDPRPWVQVRRYAHGGPYVLCGQVVQLGGSEAELFKVDTTIDGPLWVESRNVRLCSGDGRCTCEPEGEPSPTATAGVGGA